LPPSIGRAGGDQESAVPARAPSLSGVGGDGREVEGVCQAVDVVSLELEPGEGALVWLIGGGEALDLKRRWG
jgi:hypothetical protein